MKNSQERVTSSNPRYSDDTVIRMYGAPQRTSARRGNAAQPTLNKNLIAVGPIGSPLIIAGLFSRARHANQLTRAQAAALQKL